MMSSTDPFEELKSIILQEERKKNNAITEDLKNKLLDKINKIENELNDPNKFSTKIEGSKNQIIDVLGPVMGRMIKKYIATEIAKLNDNISSQTNKLTSAQYWKEKIFKNKKTDITKINQPEIEEILMINKESGLLLGCYINNERLDKDMIAGMLTAIKAFMEDTFSNKAQEVGFIEYSDYGILLHSLGSYYYSVVFSGRKSKQFEEFIIKELNTFSETQVGNINKNNNENFNDKMKLYFENTCKKLKEKLF